MSTVGEGAESAQGVDTAEEFAFDAVERLAAMSRAEVDELPYGLLVLDPGGTIEQYNRYEATLSRLDPARVVGRNWFRQVAPCTRVEAFEGRFRALLADRARWVDRFGFRFNFAHGAQDVLVQLAVSPERDRVFVTVARRVRAGGEPLAARARERLDVDEASGAAVGPLGLSLALPLDAAVAALDSLDATATARLGQACGEALANAAAPWPRDGGDAAAPDAALAALGQAWARAGWGRMSVDSAAWGTGPIELLVRPPDGGGSVALARLYESALAAALGAIDPRGALSVVCLDARDPVVVPWRFVADEPAAAARLAARRDAGEAPETLRPWADPGATT